MCQNYLSVTRSWNTTALTNSAQQTIVAADGFKSYYDILMLGESDIVNLVKRFSESTVVAGKISFVLCQTNLLKATIH